MIQCDSTYAKAYIYLGYILDKKTDERAINYYKKAFELDPQNSLYDHKNLTREDTLQANRSYELAISSSIKDTLFYVRLGNDLRGRKKYELATESYLKALELGSSNARTYNGLGLALTYREMYPAAIDNFEKALKHFPENDNIKSAPYGNLALIFNNQHKYDKAFEYAEKAIKLNNKLGNYYNHRGFSHLKRDEMSKAKQDFKECEKLAPRYNKLYFSWACYYALKDRPNKAIESLQKAVDLGYDFYYWVEKEESLKSIRQDARYAQLIKEMRNRREKAIKN